MLLNLSIFMWFGAVCPWPSFVQNDGIIPISRLICLGVLILLLRRMPIIFATHKFIHQVEQFSHALYLGFFGPIGVGAIFYLFVARKFLQDDVLAGGQPREDAERLADTLNVIVWFLVICSIVRPRPHSKALVHRIICFLTSDQIVHGLSVPLGKAGFHIPRTYSRFVTID